MPVRLGHAARRHNLVPCRIAEVEPDEVKARIARGEDVFLLDVREPDEVEAWAYPIGVNIPLGQLGERLDEVPRDVTVVVACHMGGRSATAAEALSEAGWTAENLTGGALAWAAGEARGSCSTRRARIRSGPGGWAGPVGLVGIEPTTQGL